jgi:hypothetical protein
MQKGDFMPSIKFNQLTKEIEMKGSESFIESNFEKIQDLLVESFGVKKVIVSRKTKANRKPISFVITPESQTSTEIKKDELSEVCPTLPATDRSIPKISHELKTNRPPVKKYIRKVGIPGHQRMVVQVVEQKPSEISIASLKEKFGLSESKIGGIIRDAEKLGKIRKAMNGSYVWAQD